MNALWSLLGFFFAIASLVSFHEFGHYLAAKICGVRVLKFSVGFGKPLWSYQSSPDSTEWTISRIPLGGYVKMDETTFKSKKLWQRSFIVAAGPLANFLLAIILLAILFLSGVKQLPSKLSEPPVDSVAFAAGIYAGDTVTGWKSDSADLFRPIVSWNQLRWKLMDSLTAKKGFSLEVRTANGDTQVIVFKEKNIPNPVPNQDPISHLGIKPDINEPIAWFNLEINPLEAIPLAIERVWDISKVSVRMLLGMFTGESSIKQIGGPLSIADMAGKTAQVGWQSYLGFLALISISLGILNLVPLPMLDGGQLLYDAWELITGKKISPSWQELFQKVGVAGLMLLTMLALFNDISRLFLR
ncbi:RIP metalloprotease [Polynucleobacter sp. MWH-Spelu-300-X4]|uniref:M50 family metallopeptidase n=1 Tax=Polynucleobacter sp. MWH-Spelu-300-X4 TaxID=2689109 RepID=UPI001BFE1149|nr:RIP metalloprotease [Polynucleobacter sp. MWH-Spelu-300-X4]QWD80574.1 RIP metalloprotease [Polynucleobacter sp. MWH-Spelu-300-X4]